MNAQITSPLKVVQISDCHLFSDISRLHCGANVYENLSNVIKNILHHERPDYIVFTGDLTQDHSEQSYQQFVNSITQHHTNIPVMFLAGNHDDYQLMNQYLVVHPFSASTLIESPTWQILLIETKSETPAGFISHKTFEWLKNSINPDKKQLLMMHHHAIDVGYFIDKHGLINKNELWEVINSTPSIAALACGHVHQSLSLLPEVTGYALPLYTCPATSIQFDINQTTSACNGQGPGYRVFELSQLGLTTTSHFIK